MHQLFHRKWTKVTCLVFEQPGLSSVGSTRLGQLVLTHTGLPIAFYAWH